jgi:3-hydroxyacyl-CoA dehydrogenase/enoyl-CoA hydratase/3-hydroxybutyryl-CoA epimerase/enoyl-CoA isomerase
MTNPHDRELEEPDRSTVNRTAGRVGVVGAGQMGSGIAAVLVRAGLPAAMVDVNPKMLETGIQMVRKVAPGQVNTLASGTEPAVLADCDVVIEAVTEDESVKTAIYRSLADILSAGTILASNTSTIPISRMAAATSDPALFAGMHFFHPAHRMELVEIIRGRETGDATADALEALARRIGKTPIVVRDCPGFLVTRVLFPYLNQALQLLQEGAAMDEIDAAATSFGMPTGPIALLDFIGLDTAHAISTVMAEGYPDRARPSALLAGMVAAGHLGRKTGAGFRSQGAVESGKDPDQVVQSIVARHRIAHEAHGRDEIVDRLFLPMLVEATRAIEDGIVREPADVDLGVILGLGFPAARGGILGWCDGEGSARVLERLERFESLGPAFQPTDLLRKMALRGETFHAFARPRAEG